MKDSKGTLKIVGIVLLVVFLLFVGGPILAKTVGITLGLFGLAIGLAVGLIKLALVIAVVYLVLVGVRAMLR